jgi:cytochrome c
MSANHRYFVARILNALSVLCATSALVPAEAARLTVTPTKTQTLIRKASGRYKSTSVTFTLISPKGKLSWSVKSLPKWLGTNQKKGSTYKRKRRIKLNLQKAVANKRAPGTYRDTIKFRLRTKKKKKTVKRTVALRILEDIGPGDPKAGEIVFNKCKACHDSGTTNKVGPYLAGVYGRVAGTVPGFSYSDAIIDYGKAWKAGNLDQFLEDPIGFIPGNTMAFAGLPSAQDRADVIAYLKTLEP